MHPSIFALAHFLSHSLFHSLIHFLTNSLIIGRMERLAGVLVIESIADKYWYDQTTKTTYEPTNKGDDY